MRVLNLCLIPLWVAFAPQILAGQDTPQWALGPPEFEIGGVEADVEYALTALGGVTVLGNGNVVVGDRVAPFLKVFGPTGEFLRALGRFGGGPGEYERVNHLDWCAPGELTVSDVQTRVHRYDEEMELLSTGYISLDAVGGGSGYRSDCHPNGFRIATGWGDIRAQFEEGLYQATAPVALFRGDSEVTGFGERLSSERLGTLRPDGTVGGSGPHPFGRTTVVALGTDRVYIGEAGDYEIEVFDLQGRPQTSMKWEGPSLAYDQEFINVLKDKAVSAASKERRPELRRWYDDMPELDQLPAYDRILVSGSDEVWVRQFVRPGSVGEEWVVFGADQRLIGRLSLPLRSTLWEVRGERVVYSVLDEFDVPIVRISRLLR